MKKILCIPTGSMGAGGAETFMMKIFRKMDSTKLHMDFCVTVDNESLYDQEILDHGSKLYHITPKTISATKYKRDLVKVLQTEKYDVVLRLGDTCFSFFDLLIAKQCGVPCLAFRSCNSSAEVNKLLLIVHHILKGFFSTIINIKIAPSTEAARFTFGNRDVKKNKVHILHNGLEIQSFRYSESGRDSIRKQFDISDKFVVGHVGRFFNQKNHAFLVDIFFEIAKRREDAVLLLVGNGELEKKIRMKVKELHLTDKVIFAGIREDMRDIYSAMDVFIFPSLYEGMPNALIEAQANGIPCFVADTITKEAEITGLVKYISLEDNAEEWSNCIDKCELKRRDTSDDFIRNKYDIQSVVEDFTSIICKG